MSGDFCSICRRDSQSYTRPSCATQNNGIVRRAQTTNLPEPRKNRGRLHHTTTNRILLSGSRTKTISWRVPGAVVEDETIILQGTPCDGSCSLNDRFVWRAQQTKPHGFCIALCNNGNQSKYCSFSPLFAHLHIVWNKSRLPMDFAGLMIPKRPM